jgi:hypothetical protein
MRSLRLNRQFDCVFIHDAICYMTSLADLGSALETAYIHLRPGGAALFEPDEIRENFKPTTNHGGHDASDGRGLRYLEWAHDPDPTDNTYTTDFALLLRTPDGAMTYDYDHHLLGLFSEADWLRLLSAVGFHAKSIDDSFGRVVFVGQKPI